MKNPYEVLQEKETELAHLRHEVECLRIAAPLLDGEPNSENQNSQDESSTAATLEPEPETKATGTEGLFSSYGPHPRFWRGLRRER